MIPDNYTLLLRTGPQSLAAKTNDCSVIDTITNEAVEWARNKRYQGGADVGTFKVFGDVNKLASYYQTWLGLDVLEIDQGIKTWNGQIRRVELHAGSLGVARDMNLMYNKVKVQYTNDDGVVLKTSYKTNSYSIAQYGTREEEVTGLLTDSTDADHQADFILALHGWPPRFACAGIREIDAAPFLLCYVNGYIHTINDKYAPYESTWPVPVNTETVSDAIEDIIDDSDYVKVQRIGSNSIDVFTDDGEGERAGNYLDKLLEITNSSEQMHHGWVDNDREYYYETEDFVPKYYIKGGRVYADSGGTVLVAPRHISPGVFRVLDLPIIGPDETSLFEDRRDVLIEDISIDPFGVPTYNPVDDTLADYMSYTQSVKRWESGSSLSRPRAFPGWDEIEKMYQERISGEWKNTSGGDYTTGWSTGGF